jgi:hypothetical protein
MYIFGMWLWRVPKGPWFWAEVAVKAWRDLATLAVHYLTICVRILMSRVPALVLILFIINPYQYFSS